MKFCCNLNFIVRVHKKYRSGTPSTSAAELALIDRLVRPRVIHGDPFTERKSTFQAHLLPISSVEEVDLFKTYLLQNNKVR